MATSVFLGVGEVSVAAAGAIGGDGSVGDPIEVQVDDESIEIDGANALTTIGASTSFTAGSDTVTVVRGLITDVSPT